MGWIPHIGEDFIKDHYREPPPGRRHAVCNRDICEVHEDYVNPIEDPIGHLICDAPHIASSLLVGGLAFLNSYFKDGDLRKAVKSFIITLGITYAALYILKSLLS